MKGKVNNGGSSQLLLHGASSSKRREKYEEGENPKSLICIQKTKLFTKGEVIGKGGSRMTAMVATSISILKY